MRKLDRVDTQAVAVEAIEDFPGALLVVASVLLVLALVLVDLLAPAQPVPWAIDSTSPTATAVVAPVIQTLPTPPKPKGKHLPLVILWLHVLTGSRGR